MLSSLGTREMMGAAATWALASVLGLTAPSSAFAGDWAHPVPLESIPAATRDRVRSIVPNAVPAFALHSDWRPLDAGSDTAGRSFFFLDRGSLSDALAACGPDGRLLWEHEVTGCNATNGGIMQLGANGSVLATVGMSEEGDARYLLLRPDGSTALDDTLESHGGGRVMTLSPCGKYYYRYRQGPNEITLQLVAGGARSLHLPVSSGSHGPLMELPTRVHFISFEYAIMTTSLANIAPRRVLCDLSVEPPRMIRLDPHEDLSEQNWQPRLAGDHTSEDLILVEEWESEYDLKYEVCSYDSLGTRKWHQYPNLRSSWIAAAKDRPIVAVGNSTWLTTLDARTGRVFDTQPLWRDEVHSPPWGPREIAFGDGLLALWARGGDAITPTLISVKIGDDGKIAVPIVTRDWMWGLRLDRPICGAAVPDSAGGWLIAGFRRR